MLASGRRVVGAGQSAGMLEQARRRGIAAALHQVTLQDLSFDGEFVGALTIDAMENVPPEDWPGVLSNLHGQYVERLIDEGDWGTGTSCCGVEGASCRHA